MSEPAEEPEVQRADPRARGKAMLWLAGAAAAGLAGLVWLQQRVEALRGLAETDVQTAIEQGRLLIDVMAAVTFVGAALIGLLLLRLAARVRAAERFPPPGWPVVRDVRVKRGQAARRLATLAAVGAGAVVAGGLAAALLLVQLGTMLAG